MLIADSFSVEAPIESVWGFFFDLERMRQSVPGVEMIEQVDDRTYRGRIRVRVGAISAAFGGTATLTDLEPPTRLAARLNGEDKSVASIVQGTFASTLRAVPGGTEVNYQMDVSLRGRLAQFGTAAVNSTARKMTAEFTARLREVLVNGTAPSEPGPPSDPGRTEADRTAGE